MHRSVEWKRLSIFGTNSGMVPLRSGRYRIGDRIPGEHDLARELGVGRSAVREAVRELISLTLLEIRPRAGTFVRALQRRAHCLPADDSTPIGWLLFPTVLDW